ncbi:MAG: winged helix-turn-helix domain-containing protein [Salinibacterium sp.]|nr:winged helix-turn-helix domain-containing protein [Salinibacterium sp.]
MIALGGPRHRKLLAALLVKPREPVSVERLIDLLWGSPRPPSAANMLHVRVSEVRRMLRGRDRDASILERRSSGYVLAATVDDVDSLMFEKLVAEGRRELADGDPERASRRFYAALELWRSDPLPEVADFELAQPVVAALLEMRVQTIEDAIEADLRSGLHYELIGRLRGLVDEFPLRERFSGQLMVAMYRSGRQSDALEQYARLRGRLAAELGIDPAVELQELRLRILTHDPTLVESSDRVRTTSRRPDNLPSALTSFVGRRLERSELHGLLSQARLVTIVGVGGVGKSRLALEYARDHRDEHPGGVWLIELSPVSDSGLLLSTTAHVLGVFEHPERHLFDQIVDSLRTEPTILVFDNCEHLVEAVAALVPRLLQECPRLRIVCTSRERLHVSGERVFSLEGLMTEPTGVNAEGDAVTLFGERANAAQFDVQLNTEQMPMVIDICRRLDGLPLAIELAASRVSALGLGHIAGRLDDTFRLLGVADRSADGRHRTLSALVDWSFDLLSAEEKSVYTALSAFVGTFTLEAAESVCGPSAPGADITWVMSRLVDKSLVQADRSTSEYRYRLLDTLRAYCLARLREWGQLDDTRDRHATYFCELASAARQELRSSRQRECLDRLSADHDNVRAALGWLLQSGRSEEAARIATSVYPFWDLRGHYAEGRERLEQVLRAISMSSQMRARALMGVATLASIQGDADRAISACREAAEISQRESDLVGLAHALSYMGFARIWLDDLAGASDFLDEAVSAARSAGAAWEWGWALLFQAIVALSVADNRRTIDLTHRSDEVLAEIGDLEAKGWNHLSRACAWLALGDHFRACSEARDGLLEFFRLGGIWGLSEGLIIAAILLARLGHLRQAARLLGAGQKLRDLAGTGQFAFVQVMVDDEQRGLISALGEAAYQSDWNIGAAGERNAAVAAALRSLEPYVSGT